jgi:hypothetical protein
MTSNRYQLSALIPHLVAIARVTEIYGKMQVEHLESLEKILVRIDRRSGKARAKRK